MKFNIILLARREKYKYTNQLLYYDFKELQIFFNNDELLEYTLNLIILFNIEFKSNIDKIKTIYGKINNAYYSSIFYLIIKNDILNKEIDIIEIINKINNIFIDEEVKIEFLIYILKEDRYNNFSDYYKLLEEKRMHYMDDRILLLDVQLKPQKTESIKMDDTDFIIALRSR